MRPVLPGEFEWEGIKFELVKGHHVYANKVPMRVYGLFFQSPDTGKKVYFTADTMMTKETKLRCHKADIIFHDCETYAHHSGVHAHYDDLAKLEPHIKSKMWLYHYGPNPAQVPVSDGFLGFACKHQVVDL
jgi:ribonuclease BN (tRNA processing enzyme)